jgi:hypothetical protein
MNRKIVTAAHLGVVVAAAACGTGPEGKTGPTESSATQASALTSRADARAFQRSVVSRLSPTPPSNGSTVPANGDLNPYGVAFVPGGFPPGGLLHAGDVIVSNFNNVANLQGTGTTIVRVNPTTSPSLFFEQAASPGLSTALGVLKKGFVLVGNVPSTDGSGVCTPGAGGQEQNVGQGALLVIDRNGKLVQTLASPALLDGPWDLTLGDDGSRARVFVSNVLSGSVTRLDLRVGDDAVVVEEQVQIASGYAHRCDPAAFVVGPTGLALDPDRDVLYVASTADNAIFAVARASTADRDHGRGTVVVGDKAHLHGPLGLVRAPNGNLISAQSDAVNPDPNQTSEIVEFTSDGRFVVEFSVEAAPGSAFGLALEPLGRDLRFAAVDDGQNVLDIWAIR